MPDPFFPPWLRVVAEWVSIAGRVFDEGDAVPLQRSGTNA